MTYIASTNILLPFDGSEAAIHAVRHVAARAKASKVHVLNVQDAAVPDSAFAAASYAIVQWHLREGEAIVRHAMDILSASELLVDPEVAFGRPAETICRVARARGCSLIVLGTRARHPLVSLLSGSVACRVTRESPVPVLLVRNTREPVMRMPRYVIPPIGA
jgi:nucleotide-binding universal stress UspA family protein